MEKLVRIGDKVTPKPIYLTVGEETMTKITKLAAEQNATRREIVRYLVDMACEGLTEFR